MHNRAIVEPHSDEGKDREEGRLLERWSELRALKQDKQSILGRIRQYLLLTDSEVGRVGSGANSTRVVNNEAQTRLLRYSKNSLVDIVNAYERWFTLGVVREVDIDEDVVNEWANKAAEDLYRFINDSLYYICVITDKLHYDLYGFSAMTFWIEDGEMVINPENCFDLYFESNLNKVMSVYWTRQYTQEHIKESFNFTIENAKKGGKYKVLSCLVPNNYNYLNYVENPIKKYAQVYFLQSYQSLMGASKVENIGDLSVNFDTEIGERQYFNELPTIVARDMIGPEFPYGDGIGKRALLPAENTNEAHLNTKQTSKLLANPPISAPHDLFLKFKKTGTHGVRGGMIFPQSYTGRGLEFLKYPGNLDAQLNYFGIEKEQISNSVPAVQQPQKKARQSQFEIQKMIGEADQNSFMDKMFYLSFAVSKHLNRMFSIAYSLGKIEKLPAGLSLKDVKPSISNLILKAKKKQKAQDYVESLGLSQGFFPLYPEVRDNLDPDTVVRNIRMSKGTEDGLIPLAKRKEIREAREEMVKKEQENVDLQIQNESLLASANADKLRADSRKSDAQAESEGVAI